MVFQPPMTMMDFFRKSAGKWFTERSVHHFDVVADESGQSNLIVTVIEPDDPRVKEACELHGLDLSLAKGGSSFSWQSNMDDREPNPDYAAVLIDVPDDETGLTGKLIRDKGYVEGLPVISRYWFGKDGVLTIDTDYDKNQGQERCWFITDDFRVRVGTVQMLNGISLVSYCSERRCVSSEVLKQMVQKHKERLN
ncbi:phycobiliprotein lyase [Myxosarcina sp. GI1]|uniref:phycobiliprotein lyase n=1 Tax=Myxosarcina sp. GI1 TaxID=1541065 RepID=UPI00055D139C|nr:phycobiliprotein lyase [Myxosarcina sp. GI1]